MLNPLKSQTTKIDIHLQILVKNNSFEFKVRYSPFICRDIVRIVKKPIKRTLIIFIVPVEFTVNCCTLNCKIYDVINILPVIK